MHITHLGHACVLIEMADTRLIIDPGTFAGDLAGVRDLDAVLVTHQHPDHLDPDRFPGLVAHNRHARVDKLVHVSAPSALPLRRGMFAARLAAATSARS